jgi:hypothetical protein
MWQPSDSNDQFRQSPVLGPIHGLEDRNIFKESRCGNCSDTEELIQKVVLGTQCTTRALHGDTDKWCLGLLGLEAEIRQVLALSKRPEHEVSLKRCQR